MLATAIVLYVIGVIFLLLGLMTPFVGDWIIAIAVVFSAIGGLFHFQARKRAALKQINQ